LVFFFSIAAAVAVLETLILLMLFSWKDMEIHLKDRARQYQLEHPYLVQVHNVIDLQTGQLNVCHRPAINVGSIESYDQRCQCIHDGSNDRAVDPHMFQQDNVPIRANDSAKLAQPLNRTRNGTKDKGGDDRIEDSRGKIQVLDVR
jgi:hypothetical protein